MTDDAELLRRYADEGSEEAFSELVHRHLNAVYAAAVRQTRDAHAARDIVQIVFASLARQARSLLDRPVLLSWLYTAVHYTAAKARRTEQRRQVREQETLAMSAALGTQGDQDWEQLRPVLDEAMHDLAEPDREALLLRYFQGLTFGEMTRPLRVSEDGARKRVDRALEKLRGSLVRRGIVSTSAALATTLSAHPAPEAAPGFGTEVVTRALSGAQSSGFIASLAAMLSIEKVLISAVIVAGASMTLYQGWVIGRQTSELADLQDRILAVEARSSLAKEDFDLALRRLEAMPIPVLSVLTSPAKEIIDVQVYAAQTGVVVSPGLEFRTAPLDPTLAATLPTADAFTLTYFPLAGTPASWTELIRAGIAFTEGTAKLKDFNESHAVLAGALTALQDSSKLLQKDAGSDPELTKTIQAGYAKALYNVLMVSSAISERVDERPEAIEVTKRISALGVAILEKLPPEFRP